MNYATTQGTARYASKRIEEGLPPSAFRKLGRTQWTTSTVGFGTYRVDTNSPEHRAALEKALRQGCNLIDSSTNYTDGGSERLVGQVLDQLIASGEVSRDEVIVVSKAGYVQGENLAIAESREKAGNPYAEMVKYMEGCWHCLHPDFISEQLTRSLERLRLARLDVLLLHNPEYFFSDAKKRRLSTPLAQLRDQFYDRIRRAFERLEQEVERGRITSYGVSSNTFGSPESDPEATSITRMWDIARGIGEKRSGDPSAHRFSVIQLPLNLFESGPVLELNNGNPLEDTALEFAEEKSLAVLVNRPLNAFFNQQLVRLADFKVKAGVPPVGDALKEVAALETQFRDALAPLVQTDQGSVSATEFFRWGRELSEAQLASIPSEHWGQIESQMIRPQVQYLVGQLDAHFEAEAGASWASWRDRYVSAMENLLASIRNDCAGRSRHTSERLSQRLDYFLPEALTQESLSRKTLSVLVNTPGVSCVLNGMRRPDYVEDSLGVMAIEPFGVKPNLFESFKGV